MFPRLQKKFVTLYTLSTGLIMTFILSIAFLFYASSQENRQISSFQEHLFTLMTQLQVNPRFADSFLAQMEQNNRLIIYIEENGTPFFFPGASSAGNFKKYPSFVCRTTFWFSLMTWTLTTASPS